MGRRPLPEPRGRTTTVRVDRARWLPISRRLRERRVKAIEWVGEAISERDARDRAAVAASDSAAVAAPARANDNPPPAPEVAPR